MRKKDIWLVVCALVIAVVLSVAQFASQSVPTGSWGLHFQSSGQTPVAPADADQLAQFDAAFVGDPQEKVLVPIRFLKEK